MEKPGTILLPRDCSFSEKDEIEILRDGQYIAGEIQTIDMTGKATIVTRFGTFSEHVSLLRFKVD